MKILLIEDALRLQKMVQLGLEKLGHTVDASADGREGLDFALYQSYDVIILDLMLPTMDGLTVLQKLRAAGRNTHVIILSAKGETSDRIAGLESGADDYLPKPFSFNELVARLNALNRRSHSVKSPRVVDGAISIDTTSHEVQVDGVGLTLTAAEYAILEKLILRRGAIVTKEQLLSACHTADSEASDNVVMVHICALRNKLKKLNPATAEQLKTMRGEGYRWQSQAEDKA